MNRQIAIFSRVAGFAVKKALHPHNKAKSADQVQLLINNMNLINQYLVAQAVKLVNRAKGEEEIDTEELTLNLHDIIHLSVVSYAKRAY